MDKQFLKSWIDITRFEKKLNQQEIKQIDNDIERLKPTKNSSEIITYLKRKYPKINEQYEAERAFWTETKKLDALRIKEEAKALGEDLFTIEPNTGACEFCLQFTQNGTKVFKASELFLNGRPIPPLHPGCFCLLKPYIKDD
jgi:hypothetical protein